MEMTSYAPGTPSWVDLGTSDPSAASAFYSELFGWDCIDQGAEAGHYRMCLLRGKPVAGIGPQMQPGVPPHWTMYVSVADADATAGKVQAAGGQVLVAPMAVMTVGRMGVFMDTSGAAFAVWQPGTHLGAGLVNEPGSLCWNELATRKTEEAKAFYPVVLGWTAQTQMMGTLPYTNWKLGDRLVAGMMTIDDTWPPGVPSHWMNYFAVADTDAACATITRRGGKVTVPPTDVPPGRFAVVSDPQGAFFSVIKLNASTGG